jgi:hypothetical protein
MRKVAKVHRVPARCWPSRGLPPGCAAPAPSRRPAPAGWCAAYSSAIEPPSLWPSSQGRSLAVHVDRQGLQQGRQHLERLAVHEVGRPALRRPRAGWIGHSRGANTPGRGSRRPRTGAAESPATSTASPGPRAGTPRAAQRGARALSSGARCAPWRPAQSMSTREGVRPPLTAPPPRARAGESAGSCRWPSWAVRPRTRSGAGTCRAPAGP